MKEIEVEVAFNDSKEDVIKKLSKFEYIGEKEICDTYYYDPLRDNLKPESDLRLNETFRVRKTDKSCYMTYKKQHFKGKLWIYSDEYEVEIENYDTVQKIIFALGFEPLIIVHNKRKIYKYNDFEIELEDVEGIGLLMEVERISSDDDEMKIKEEIRNFIRSLKLKNVRELNIGKNQYLLSIKLNRKLNIFNDTVY